MNMETKTLLLVEDEENLRSMLVEQLSSPRLKVDEAKDGLEALERLSSRSYDVVLADIKMPRLTGIGLIGRARAMGCDAPFVFLTAYGDKQNVLSALRLQAFDLIEKPCDTADLKATINTVLGQKANERALREIHEQKLKEDLEELHREQIFKQSKMASLGEIAGNIAHEINTPLQVISGRVQEIKRELKRESFDKLEVLESIEKIELTSQRIGKIIQGLKNYARDGESDPFQSTSLNTIVEDSLALCNDRLKKHAIAVSFAHPFENIKIDCRSIQISQVLINLFNNACDALESLPENQKWLIIAVQKLEEKIEIAVTDGGRGIEPVVREKLFCSTITTKPQGKGTGIGLNIAKKIVEEHGGELFIDKTCPNTKFVIRLKPASSCI